MKLNLFYPFHLFFIDNQSKHVEDKNRRKESVAGKKQPFVYLLRLPVHIHLVQFVYICLNLPSDVNVFRVFSTAVPQIN